QQLALAVQGRPGVRVAPFVRVCGLQAFLFRMNEIPELIELDVLGPDATHAVIKESLAVRASLDEKVCHGVSVQPDEPSDCSHARPLGEKRERLNRLIRLNAAGREPFSGSIGASRTADLTAVALHVAVPIGAEFLEGFAVTFR